jgi:hypothetical protein
MISGRYTYASRPLRRVPRLGDRQQRPTGEIDRAADAGMVLRRGVTGQFRQFQQSVHAGQQGVGVVLHASRTGRWGKGFRHRTRTSFMENRAAATRC